MPFGDRIIDRLPPTRGKNRIFRVFERGGRTTREKRSFSILGGMCPRCEGRGSVTDFDLTALFDNDFETYVDYNIRDVELVYLLDRKMRYIDLGMMAGAGIIPPPFQRADQTGLIAEPRGHHPQPGQEVQPGVVGQLCPQPGQFPLGLAGVRLVVRGDLGVRVELGRGRGRPNSRSAPAGVKSFRPLLFAEGVNPSTNVGSRAA